MLDLIITNDGSHSLLNTALDETYHSTHGAIQESQHVFIKEGLNEVLLRNNPTNISLLEIGFGTGLNALLTLQRAAQISTSIYYTTLETYPLPFDVWSKLNYSDSIGGSVEFEHLHAAPWNEDVTILPNFKFQKRSTSLQAAEFPTATFDVVYFDAFAPNKQPEMWTIQMLKKIVDALVVNGVFVTYCAKGQLKRDLKSLGMRVETPAGPPGKREMVRAIKMEL